MATAGPDATGASNGSGGQSDQGNSAATAANPTHPATVLSIAFIRNVPDWVKLSEPDSAPALTNGRPLQKRTSN